MKAIILTLSAVAFFTSCEKPKEMDDGRPRIKAVSIAGIPQKDINFIPERYTINVQLPADAPAGGLRPDFELTANTEFIEGLTPDGAFTSTCIGSLKVANDKMTAIYRKTTIYQINFLPAPGCPQVMENVPITYSRDSSNASSMQIYVPLQNPFSSYKVFSIRLKNLSTGTEHHADPPTYLANYNLNSCSLGIDNRIKLFFHSYPKVPPGPGSYEVSITMNCDESPKTLTFLQPLVITE